MGPTRFMLSVNDNTEYRSRGEWTSKFFFAYFGARFLQKNEDVLIAFSLAPLLPVGFTIREADVAPTELIRAQRQKMICWCAAVCCAVLQCVAVRCVAPTEWVKRGVLVCCSALCCIAACCNHSDTVFLLNLSFF